MESQRQGYCQLSQCPRRRIGLIGLAANTRMTEMATAREAGSVTIVTLRGRIELGEGSALLRSTMRDLLGKGRHRILLNLSEVTSIDSAGIAELIGAFAPLKAKGGELKLLRPTKKVHDMLEVTRLSKVLDIYFEEGEALRSFR